MQGIISLVHGSKDWNVSLRGKWLINCIIIKLIVFSLLDFNYRDHFSGHTAEFDSHSTAGRLTHTHIDLLSAYCICFTKCLFWRLVPDRLCVCEMVCAGSWTCFVSYTVFNHLWCRSWDFQCISWIKSVWGVSLANVSSRELFIYRPTCSLWWKWCFFKEDWPTFPALFSCLVLSLVHAWVQFFKWVGQY